MSKKEALERVLQGQDPFAKAIIDHLLAQGWNGDRILKNIALKVYSPHEAVIRVTPDPEYPQYWVKGEYHSKGENVLSTCYACIQAAASPAEVTAAMDRFLEEAEREINQSFAVRFLGKGN